MTDDEIVELVKERLKSYQNKERPRKFIINLLNKIIWGYGIDEIVFSLNKWHITYEDLKELGFEKN